MRDGPRGSVNATYDRVGDWICLDSPNEATQLRHPGRHSDEQEGLAENTGGRRPSCDQALPEEKLEIGMGDRVERPRDIGQHVGWIKDDVVRQHQVREGALVERVHDHEHAA
eukprot:CAMPEP_0205908618 /NCGR_PEP_ID=MMETSP1325-20131115/3338_1 /ASSEMBLY_ACC=CAM_ASM_000708 /TAXON_ID=236786 /ORGANISM="Florenciella sp., Strain RCC1007" /LENGTH=111 /DNA_ID=CAMNT_0053274845 /DNA_START=418 /DNA_END=749 /DNA_ORIENTATION=-